MDNRNDQSYGQYIDHTVLKSFTVRETLKQFCDEAKEYRFASVCVNSYNIPYVAEQLKGSGVKACSVVGFPLGAVSKEVKAFETAEAVRNGAEEIDMVINVGALKDGLLDVVLADIKAVVDAAKPKASVKVIIETCYLTDAEKITVCSLAKEAGAAFVKTSSGFGTSGASVEDVMLMKKTVGADLQVKASTGIDTREVCDAMLKAGATRMGTSKGIRIIKGE